MARVNELTAPRSNRGLLVLAVLSGLVAAILVFVALARSGGGGDETSTPAVTTAKVVVAQRDIPARSEITADTVQVVEVPAPLVVKGAFVDVQPLIGETTRYPIAAGEQITRVKVGPQTEGDGLAFVVPKGQRALSVRVDEVSGVGGLLLPGDRVDVIAVFSTTEVGSDKAVTLLQNIEVLAVAQKAQEPVPPAQADTAAPPESGAVSTSGQPPKDAKPQPDARTVTLAVTPEQAQLLALVQDNGKVWLSLRPFGEDAAAQLPEANLDALGGP